MKHIKPWVNVGWYKGNPFNLFRVAVWEAEAWCVSIFEVQVAKFVIGFGFDRTTKDVM